MSQHTFFQLKPYLEFANAFVSSFPHSLMCSLCPGAGTITPSYLDSVSQALLLSSSIS